MCSFEYSCPARLILKKVSKTRPQLDVSIIIINWNTKYLLLGCLSSIFETVKNLSFEIWLVDNASSDGSVEAVQHAYPIIKVVKNRKNLGFAAADNKAFHRMQGRYALLLNTDTIFEAHKNCASVHRPLCNLTG